MAMQKQKKFKKNTAALKVMAALIFIFHLTALTRPDPGFSESQTSTLSGSVRPDGTLDFINTDGSKKVSIVIEIAETEEARAKGLMGRKSLRLTDGMLFVYEREELLYFWMKNTPASLDMIFVDQADRIVHMAEATQPMSTQTYSSRLPARYVVEVPAGFVKLFNLKTGMRIQWRRR